MVRSAFKTKTRESGYMFSENKLVSAHSHQYAHTKKTHLAATEIGFLMCIGPSFTIDIQALTLQYGVTRVKECPFLAFPLTHLQVYPMLLSSYRILSTL
jgi:hypothetical protein